MTLMQSVRILREVLVALVRKIFVGMDLRALRIVSF